jgi:hypothetical protein
MPRINRGALEQGYFYVPVKGDQTRLVSTHVTYL